MARPVGAFNQRPYLPALSGPGGQKFKRLRHKARLMANQRSDHSDRQYGQGDLVDGNPGDRSASVLLCPGGQSRGQQSQAADGHQLALIGQPLGREFLEPGQQGEAGGNGDGLEQGVGW
jgi:hypothetical protein